MLSGKSACTAVLIANKILYITANEFSTTTTEAHEIYKLITDVMGYFRKVADNKDTEDELKKTFNHMCERRIKALGSDISIPNTFNHNKIIDDVPQRNEKPASEIMKEYREQASIANHLLADYKYLYGSFSKFKNTIKDKKALMGRNLVDSKKAKITDEQFHAIKTRPKILTKEPKANVHAEVKLLGEIIDLINKSEIKKDQTQTINIGISKLCCLHCRVMIEQANIVLNEKGYNTSFKIRGKHDIDFDKKKSKWIPPTIFENGYNLTQVEDKNSLVYRIGFLTKMNVE